MKPVAQSEYGVGHGNCFSACVASILELPIEEVPNFCAEGQEGGLLWMERFAEWLVGRGWGFAYVKHGESHYVVAGAYGIASGPSPRFEGVGDDYLHAVVVRAMTVNSQDRVEGDVFWRWELNFEHDPHPSGDFLRDGLVLDTIWIIPGVRSGQ